MTSASSFQMLRGSVIIFTGLLSVAFLGRRLAISQWLGILATIVGLVVVGLADLLSKPDSEHKLSEVITGAALGTQRLPVLPCSVPFSWGAHQSQPTDLVKVLGEGTHLPPRGGREYRGAWRGA